jgi:hypothetical protein
MRAPVGRFLAAAAVAAALLAAPLPVAAGGVVNSTFFGNDAIKGYDPVAYFTEGRPVQGSDEFEYEWMGADWRFATAANRDAFAAEPEKYAPQYGGYCAYAVSQGTTADIDPEAWTIVGDRLYLNLSKDVQKLWEQDVPGYIQKADANWPKIRTDLE